MKRTVLTFGLISGAVAVAMMFAVIPFLDPSTMQTADVLGYTSMVLSALFVFFGIRSYREHAGGGRLTFGRGMAIGLLITLVSAAIYVAAFELMYFKLYPEFGEKFSACMIERARTTGATPERIEEVTRQARTLKELYDNPVTNAALAFATAFPVGLVVTAISAAILRPALMKVAHP